MDLSDLQHGSVTDIPVRVVGAPGLLSAPRWQEALIDFSSGASLSIGDAYGRIECVTHAGQSALADLEGGTFIACFVDEPRPESEDERLLRVWSFSRQSPVLSESLIAYVDEHALPKANGVTLEKLLADFDTEFLLPPSTAGLPRIVASGFEDTAERIRLYGRTLVIDVDVDGTPTVTSVRAWRNLPHALQLLTGSIRLTSSIDDASSPSESLLTSEHLAFWKAYHDTAMRLEHERQFAIGAPSFVLTGTVDELLAGYARVSLHSSSTPVQHIELGDHVAVSWDGSPPGAPPKGIVTDIVDPEITLEIDSSQLTRTNAQRLRGGAIELSIRGAESSYERQLDAWNDFAQGQVPIKSLPGIVDGSSPGQPRSTVKHGWRSPSTEEIFGAAGPNEQQIAAIESALNTPDVALIQGPPGTGKTKVLAAIAQRLAEIAIGRTESAAMGASREILLTSGQNATVAVAANAATVLGFPTFLERSETARRGSSLGMTPQERWLSERRIEAHESLQLHDTPAARCRRMLLAVHGRVQAGFHPAELAHGVSEACNDWPPLCSGAIRENLERRVAEAALGHPRHGALVREIRALRTDPVSFADDGLLGLRRLCSLLDDELDGLGAESPTRAVIAERNRLVRLIEDLTPDGIPSRTQFREIEQARNGLMDAYWSPDLEVMSRNQSDALLDAVATAIREIDARYADGHDRDYEVQRILEDFLDGLSSQSTIENDIAVYSPALAATCQFSARIKDLSAAPGRRTYFDSVIVDEAAKVDPLDLLIPMSLARRRVALIGDQRQIGPYMNRTIERLAELASPDAASDALRKAVRESPFSTMFEHVATSTVPGGFRRAITLDTQYRMHPSLGKLISSCFYEPYGVTISSPRPAEDFAHSIDEFQDRCAAWLDVPRQRGVALRDAGGSWYREPEADEVAQLVTRLLTNPDVSETIGVITFYKAQAEAIKASLVSTGVAEGNGESWVIRAEYREALDGKAEDRVLVGVVDAFQGREFDIVVLSTVRTPTADTSSATSAFGFVAMENRLCVALSRQRKLLIVVGDESSLIENHHHKAIRGLVAFSELARAGDRS